MSAQSGSMFHLLLGAAALCVFVEARVANAQAATAEVTATANQDDLKKRLDGFMALGPNAYPIKEKDGRLTHILLVGEAPLRKSLGVAAATTATQRATDLANGQLPLFLEQKVTAYSGSDGESIVLTEGDASGAVTENGKVVEKTTAWTKRQAEMMLRGVTMFSKQVTDEKVVVALLWTEKSARQAQGVIDANKALASPKPRPAPGTVTPGTVVNPDADQLLK
jgi:hypothetical protein